MHTNTLLPRERRIPRTFAIMASNTETWGAGEMRLKSRLGRFSRRPAKAAWISRSQQANQTWMFSHPHEHPFR